MNPAADRRSARLSEAGDVARVSLKYRFGFHLCRTGEAPRRLRSWFQRAGWGAVRHGVYTLTVHPHARQEIHQLGGAALHFVGEVWTETGVLLEDRVARIDVGQADWLAELADELCGRFVLMVFEGDRVRALNDAIGSQSIFYSRTGPFALASHTDLVAKTIGAERDPEALRLLADPGYRRRPRSLPGGFTIYGDVRALVPNNLYDSAHGGTRRYWPREPLRPSTEGDFTAALDRHLASLETFVSRNYRPVFGLTGGVDTRLAIASWRQGKTPFETITWGTNKVKPREIGIVRDLAAVLRCPQREFAAAPVDPCAVLAAKDAGAMRPPGNYVTALACAYGPRLDTVFLKGWGAEVMRGFYNNAGNGVRGFGKPAALAKMYYRSPLDETNHAFATRAMQEFVSVTDWESLKGSGYDPNDIFYWEHRMGMWGASVNSEMDVVMRNLIVFNSRRLYIAALGLPPAVRHGKRLFLNQIIRLAPDLGAIPLAEGDPREKTPKPLRPVGWRTARAFARWAAARLSPR